MPSLNIQKIDTTHVHFPAVFALREKILRHPLGLSLYNEDTSGDVEETIFIMLHDAQVIACLMCKDLGQDCMKLRQMAVDIEWQRKGIGKQLIRAAEQDAQKIGFNKLSLHARLEAIPFYQKLGFVIHGSEFIEVSIPHYLMKKSIM